MCYCKRINSATILTQFSDGNFANIVTKKNVSFFVKVKVACTNNFTRRKMVISG